MRDKKGITLISLAITIIVMLIIAGIATTTGLESVQNAKRTSFITELEIIQERVNTIYEKRKLNKEDISYYNSLGQDISVVEQEKKVVALNGKPEEGYRYFSKNDLNKLNLENITQDVMINFETADVVSVTGIKIDGKNYYQLKDIPDYQNYEVNYVNKNTRFTDI